MVKVGGPSRVRFSECSGLLACTRPPACKAHCPKLVSKAPYCNGFAASEHNPKGHGASGHRKIVQRRKIKSHPYATLHRQISTADWRYGKELLANPFSNLERPELNPPPCVAKVTRASMAVKQLVVRTTMFKLS